jgi:2-polyprenyl-3-methyl-5-hydroxy-6-metoxy-1,4-benzoquinol methylase
MSAPTIEQIKSNMLSAWMAGDFSVVAKSTAGSSEDFIARLGIPSGSRVLDVACGSGNTAIPLARSGCIVTGVDIAPNILVKARERAAAEGLTIAFDEGDAEALPYADASFDAVISMFGAMFAPRPELVASEFTRILKPGGLLAMANWNIEGFTGKMFKLGSKHVPPNPTLQPPALWGDDPTVRARLAEGFTNIQTQIVPIDFDFPTSPAGTVEFFRKYYGPTQASFARLDEAGQAAFAADLESLWSTNNVSPDAANQTLVRNEYLQITATRK